MEEKPKAFREIPMSEIWAPITSRVDKLFTMLARNKGRLDHHLEVSEFESADVAYERLWNLTDRITRHHTKSLKHKDDDAAQSYYKEAAMREIDHYNRIHDTALTPSDLHLSRGSTIKLSEWITVEDADNYWKRSQGELPLHLQEAIIKQPEHIPVRKREPLVNPDFSFSNLQTAAQQHERLLEEIETGGIDRAVRKIATEAKEIAENRTFARPQTTDDFKVGKQTLTEIIQERLPEAEQKRLLELYAGAMPTGFSVKTPSTSQRGKGMERN
jgi:hypothetical protein